MPSCGRIEFNGNKSHVSESCEIVWKLRNPYIWNMARFTPQILDEIRNRLTLSDIVGRRVTYDKRKSQPQKGDHWACCPFHNEKTPSFHVDDRKNMYHCFGCGATGDHFKFLVEKDGLSFPEAVEQLADEAGVSLPKSSPQQIEQEKKRASLYDVMALAQRYFLEQLQGAHGAPARGYLQQRGLTLETQRRFGIGFAPKDRSGLKQYLAEAKIDHGQMVEAGLLVAGPDVPVSYDKFRDRIMFPILDLRERVIAFGGRAMSPDNPAKYMNSPETPLFSKRTVLYNAANARRASHNNGRIIVVEGYMDVIALAQAGIDEAVAPLGTALTAEQLQLLWKFANEPVLCFDGDEAGLRAAHRSSDIALPLLRAGKTVQFALLPDGQDPDDLVNSDGVDAMEDLLSGAKSLFDLIWAKELEVGPLDTPERKAALTQRLKQLTNTIQDPTVRGYYDEAYRERMRSLFTPQSKSYGNDARARSYSKYGGQRGNGSYGRGDFGQQPMTILSDSMRRNPLTSKNYDRPSSKQKAISPRDFVLMGTLVNHPVLLQNHLETFADLDFENSSLKRLQAALIEICSRDPSIDPNEMRNFLVSRHLGNEVSRIDDAIRALRWWQAEPDAAEDEAELAWKQALTLHYKANTLTRELKDAETAFATESTETNLERLLDINAQIKSLDGIEALVDGFQQRS